MDEEKAHEVLNTETTFSKSTIHLYANVLKKEYPDDESKVEEIEKAKRTLVGSDEVDGQE